MKRRKAEIQVTAKKTETFRALKNKQLVDEMNKNLLVENPDDFQRRAFQDEVLNLDPEFISSSFKHDIINVDDIGLVEEEEQDFSDKFLQHDFRTWPMDAQHFGYLSEQTIASMLLTTDCKEITIGDGRSISFAAASQAGYYPTKNGKENEDSFLCGVNATNPSKQFSGDELVEDHNALFSIFDGHGPTGKACSTFVRDVVEKEFEHQLESTKRRRDIEGIFNDAYMEANERLIQNNDFDTDYSGTTAVSLCLEGGFFHVANVGDSRCVLASRSSKDEDYYVQDLSDDHTPVREDEYKRIRSNGGIILTSDQYDTMEDSQHSAMTFSSVVSDSSSSIEPLRVWATGGKYPGSAFTRSIGDGVAKSLGVTAEPEHSKRQITDNHEFFILGSDGIFDFISSKEAVDIVSTCADANEACRALIGTSYARWIKQEERTDDITVIVGFLS